MSDHRKLMMIPAFALLVAFAPSERPDLARIMDAIEHEVRMPKQADALDRYARFYSQAPSGKVVAVYVGAPFDDLAIGQRRWVQDVDHLPRIADGGCLVVNVIYDPRKRKVLGAGCNGFA